jgi:hypothetical protein
MQLSFYSLLASAQEVDFFTDILLETDIPCELDHNTLATLESIPEEVLLEEEETAIEEQIDIEMALYEEYLKHQYCVVITDDFHLITKYHHGTWEECTSFVQAHADLKLNIEFAARFFEHGNDNEYACVKFIPTDTNPTGYITLTRPRRS